MSMQVSSGAATSGINRDEYIDSVANDVLGKLPETLWDIALIRAEYSEVSPTLVVLFQ